MIEVSVRVRLTAWYLAILAVTALGVIAASWWLSARSVDAATDSALRARVDGVRDFLENPDTVLSTESVRDEFREYAELTRGEALLGVVDASGTILCRPAVRGWTAIENATGGNEIAHDGRPADLWIGEAPFRVASRWIKARGRHYKVTVAAPMKDADAALARFHRLLALVLPVALLVAGAGGYWISRRALAPVDRMTSAVQAITLERLDRRLELPPAEDELRRLASTFNDMLARLQAAVGEMARFTADASHELRTPVTLMRTTAELSLRHKRSANEYRRALEDVLAHSEQMTGLLNDLLMLARTDAGIELRRPMEVDLADLAALTVREIQPGAAGRSVDVRIEEPRDACIVQGDRLSLRRLLTIVLDNAMKYTPDGGEVQVSLQQVAVGSGAAAVALTVTDSGIGIDPAEMPYLFDRFYRGVRARQRAPEGSGLGLAIARTIVEQHHGSIAVFAGNLVAGQHGCRVEVVLPLACDLLSGERPTAPLAVAAHMH